MKKSANRKKEVQTVEPVHTELVSMRDTSVFFDMAKEYKKMMLIYDSGIKKITTKFEILNNESHSYGNHNPIKSIQSRLKSPESITAKLNRKGLPITVSSIQANLHDVAGIRVICSYISDIYALRDMLLCQKDVRLLIEKDYIKSPKPNGYRSLHLVVETDLYLAHGEFPVQVEIQFRTIAMDFWASLEHEIHYKSTNDIPTELQQDLLECAEIISLTDRRMERIRKQAEQYSP